MGKRERERERERGEYKIKWVYLKWVKLEYVMGWAFGPYYNLNIAAFKSTNH